MKVFITGDRSATPILIGFVAMEMLRAAGKDAEVYTGDNAGVEEYVRQIAQDSEFPVTVVESTFVGDGYVDWDARHKALAADPHMHVVVIHTDPLASRIGRSVSEAFGLGGENADDRVSFVTPESLILG